MTEIPIAICGGLNENDSHGLICLTAWSAASGTLWEGLRDAVLLEEASHGDYKSWLQKYMPFLVPPFLCPAHVSDMSSQLLL